MGACCPRVRAGTLPRWDVCTADAGADALDLDNTNRGVTDAMLGRWVQISGRLESETSKDPDNLRELDVASISLVPVVPP